MSVRLSQIVSACLLLACTFAQAFAQSDTYPDKPIRIITHSAAGGAPDVMLRIVGDRLGTLLGQQIVVLNQPGAGGAVAARAAASAASDGYTLYMPAASAFVTLAGLQPNLLRAALVAPVGTPDAIVNKVSDVLSKVVGETEVQKKLAMTGSYVRPMSPSEVMAFIQADQQMWKPILERIAANP